MSVDFFGKFKRYEILLEYKLLATNTPRHMYLYPNGEQNWSGLLFLHSGIYKHAAIEFMVVFDNFPEQAPVIYVQTPIYHPLIDRSGKFDASYQFKMWKASTDHVYHLLHFFNNTFREDVLLMINPVPVDHKKINESLRNQNVHGFGSISIEPIDEDAFRKMRQIIFE